MNRPSVVAGARFGRWLVIERAVSNREEAMWWCRCDCGQEKTVAGKYLRLGRSTQCKSCARRSMEREHGDTAVALFQSGMMVEAIAEKIGVSDSAVRRWFEIRGVKVTRKPPEDLTGQTFGRWTVQRDSGLKHNRAPLWLCECACGQRRNVRGYDLRNGRSRGCDACQQRAVEQRKRAALTPYQLAQMREAAWNKRREIVRKSVAARRAALRAQRTSQEAASGAEQRTG